MESSSVSGELIEQANIAKLTANRRTHALTQARTKVK
jgi:hypothetical protein